MLSAECGQPKKGIEGKNQHFSCVVEARNSLLQMFKNKVTATNKSPMALHIGSQ
jgi:hypothetical protein